MILLVWLYCFITLRCYCHWRSYSSLIIVSNYKIVFIAKRYYQPCPIGWHINRWRIVAADSGTTPWPYARAHTCFFWPAAVVAESLICYSIILSFFLSFMDPDFLTSWCVVIRWTLVAVAVASAMQSILASYQDVWTDDTCTERAPRPAQRVEWSHPLGNFIHFAV